MNEAQAKQIDEIVQQIADDDSIAFNAAFKVAVGVLRLHALDGPKGECAAGSKTQALGRNADQV
jgi:hypothetical protein